jgi:hypothetical protein
VRTTLQGCATLPPNLDRRPSRAIERDPVEKYEGPDCAGLRKFAIAPADRQMQRSCNGLSVRSFQRCSPSAAFLAGGRHLAQRLCAADTVQTKRAVQRFSAIRTRSLNDPRQSSLPTLQTVKPLSRCTTPASGAKRHPSPSARQFRLLFNGLAASALRRIFLQLSAAAGTLRVAPIRHARWGALSMYPGG